MRPETDYGSTPEPRRLLRETQAIPTDLSWPPLPGGAPSKQPRARHPACSVIQRDRPIFPVAHTNMTDKATPAASKDAATKKGGKTKLLIIGALIVLGGGGAAAFYVMRSPAAPNGEKAAVVAKATESGLITLEPFTVNLADPGGSRFLRLSVRLVVESPEEGEKAQKNNVLLARIRSSVLELLAQQTADKLITPEGKAELKTAIADHVKEVLEHTKVTDVLFTDFVVQF
ncbi:MAG: flagellar basal body-associated FliL family protein [Acidobacteriota bacterium]